MTPPRARLLLAALPLLLAACAGHEQAALEQWSIDDPVDAYECARNDNVEAIQGKRNPFIDRPDFIEKIGSW